MSIKIDFKMLEELGLSDLPQELRGPFLEQVYETLEMRTGAALVALMTSTQIDEFDWIMGGDIDFIRVWIATHDPDSADEASEKSGAELTEFASLTWLEHNLPGYQNVTQAVFDELKREIADSAAAILADAAGSPAGG